MKTITQNKISKKILFSEIIGFGCIIILIWMDEIFDIPHILFGAPPTPLNLKESIIESISVIILGIFTILYIYKILKKLKYVSGFLHVCSYCKKIRIEGIWVPIEKFISNNIDVELSHGLCPECLKKLEETL